jgi:hypothetical protein
VEQKVPLRLFATLSKILRGRRGRRKGDESMLDLLRQFFSSTGEVVKVYTLVDFYNYIKAVENLICVAFFAIFPLFYMHVIKTPSEREADALKRLEE